MARICENGDAIAVANGFLRISTHCAFIPKVGSDLFLFCRIVIS